MSEVLCYNLHHRKVSNHKYPGFVTYVKNSRIDWNFTTEPDDFFGQCLKEGSGPSTGKAIGGSGNTNYMLYSRGNPRDYEKIYEITEDSTWKWENMLKYFLRSERLDDEEVLSSAFGEYHGSNGTIGVTKDNREICDEYLRAFEEVGEDVVVDNIGAGILGYSSGLYHIVDGHRTTSSESYLPPLNDNPNLYLTRHSTATKILFDDNNNAVLWSNINVLYPKSRGEIRLRSLDPEDQPIIETGYFSDDQDLEDVVDAVLDLIKIESTPFGQDNALEFLPVAEMCRGIEFGTREYWRCHVLCVTVATWRDAGTCAIGDVVDTHLFVIGVKRLRVVDASVFPNALGGAILAPTVALAEKAAEIIIADRKNHNMCGGKK
ncbi:unnamed protein product [Chrysodeixis includens]|uniref:Uncharacterized protein n=1 Tax=Chrysodeixis includens TaxID=689277 RepID=A0A9N8L1H2_CHRIL|nr:unnamed protein product [Chrysodeixis includens]